MSSPRPSHDIRKTSLHSILHLTTTSDRDSLNTPVENDIDNENKDSIFQGNHKRDRLDDPLVEAHFKRIQSIPQRTIFDNWTEERLPRNLPPSLLRSYRRAIAAAAKSPVGVSEASVEEGRPLLKENGQEKHVEVKGYSDETKSLDQDQSLKKQDRLRSLPSIMDMNRPSYNYIPQNMAAVGDDGSDFVGGSSTSWETAGSGIRSGMNETPDRDGSFNAGNLVPRIGPESALTKSYTEDQTHPRSAYGYQDQQSSTLALSPSFSPTPSSYTKSHFDTTPYNPSLDPMYTTIASSSKSAANPAYWFPSQSNASDMDSNTQYRGSRSVSDGMQRGMNQFDEESQYQTVKPKSRSKDLSYGDRYDEDDDTGYKKRRLNGNWANQVDTRDESTFMKRQEYHSSSVPLSNPSSISVPHTHTGYPMHPVSSLMVNVRHYPSGSSNHHDTQVDMKPGLRQTHSHPQMIKHEGIDNSQAATNEEWEFGREGYRLVVRQEPERARLCSFKEENDTIDRRPVDPPPVVQVLSSRYQDVSSLLSASDLSVRVYLVPSTPNSSSPPAHQSSPHSLATLYPEQRLPQGSSATTGDPIQMPEKLMDLDGEEGAFAIFGRLSVRMPGVFRLRFVLERKNQSGSEDLAACISQPFEVFSPKLFKGMKESTALTRSFASQGFKIKLRQDLKRQPRKRKIKDSAGGMTTLYPKSSGSGKLPRDVPTSASTGTQPSSLPRRRKPLSAFTLPSISAAVGNSIWDYTIIGNQSGDNDCPNGVCTPRKGSGGGVIFKNGIRYGGDDGMLPPMSFGSLPKQIYEGYVPVGSGSGLGGGGGGASSGFGPTTLAGFSLKNIGTPLGVTSSSSTTPDSTSLGGGNRSINLSILPHLPTSSLVTPPLSLYSEPLTAQLQHVLHGAGNYRQEDSAIREHR